MNRGRPKGVVGRTSQELRALILDALRKEPHTRGELKRLLRLSNNVVHPYVDRLVDEGLVESAGKVRSGKGGASPTLYRLREQCAQPVADGGVRTQIRGPWPVSVPIRRAT